MVETTSVWGSPGMQLSRGRNLFGDALPFSHRGPQNSLVPQTELEWNGFFALSRGTQTFSRFSSGKGAQGICLNWEHSGSYACRSFKSFGFQTPQAIESNKDRSLWVRHVSP